jgi:hypothetical protein
MNKSDHRFEYMSSDDLPRDPRDSVSDLYKKTNEAQRRIVESDTQKIVSALNIEDRRWQRQLRLLMRLSTFSYGLVGFSLCVGLGLLALKRHIGADDEPKK